MILTLLPAFAAGQIKPEQPAEVRQSAEPAKDSPEKAGDAIVRQRSALNLVGATDAESGESRRNENVFLNPIDNNALKELNLRLGTTATVVEVFRPERNYFAAEFGNNPSSPLHVTGSSAGRAHGNLFLRHLNSIFKARSFFQV